jgi:hypothetical protein
MAAAGGTTEDGLRMLVYAQPPGGGRGTSYSTPIADITTQTREPALTSKDDFQGMIRSLRKEACQDNVSDSYINTSMTKNTILMVMYKNKTEEVSAGRRGAALTRVVKEPYGFICASPERDDKTGREGMYIDVICSKSEGANLLGYFISYAKASGKSYVGLSSLPSVLAYYPKVGFEFRKTCAGDPLAKLPDDIKALLSQLKKEGKPPPKTSADTYAYKEYADFMIDLHSKGLSVRRDAGTSCEKLDITADELVADDCGADGYSMKRCTLGGGGRGRSRRCCRAGGRRHRRHTRKRA